MSEEISALDEAHLDEDDSSIDDELLMSAIALVKTRGYGGHPDFAASVALVFEALKGAPVEVGRARPRN